MMKHYGRDSFSSLADHIALSCFRKVLDRNGMDGEAWFRGMQLGGTGEYSRNKVVDEVAGKSNGSWDVVLVVWSSTVSNE